MPYDYHVLHPHNRFSLVSAINDYEFPNSGPWKVVARYRDPQIRPPPPQGRIRWCSGTLISNTIEVTVKPTSNESDAGTP